MIKNSKIMFCPLCNSKLKRTYVRTTRGKESRTWNPIGYFCVKCITFIESPKTYVDLEKVNERVLVFNT